jgi:hypothetical protein
MQQWMKLLIWTVSLSFKVMNPDTSHANNEVYTISLATLCKREVDIIFSQFSCLQIGIQCSEDIWFDTIKI